MFFVILSKGLSEEFYETSDRIVKPACDKAGNLLINSIYIMADCFSPKRFSFGNDFVELYNQ